MNDELIALDEVCERYFGLSPDTARRKAALGTLPVPAFRLNNTRRGPFLIAKTALDEWVTARAEKAAKLNSQMRLAGVV